MKTYIVDAFTTEAFKGNPAGICFPDQPLSDPLMLSVAKELGFSETAFISGTDTPGVFKIRYFTPKSEIALCGHATLASAKVLFTHADLADVHFITIQNIDLHCTRDGDLVVMEFPVYDLMPAHAPDAMLEALGITAIENCAFSKETSILMLEIASAQKLTALSPDYSALIKTHDSINGVLVTARADDGLYDFYSRYFWPWKGTNEDPVTGGSHTFLAKYWSEKLGKKKMRSFQASARTGFMEVELLSEERLLIKGDAVIVLEGAMHVK
jgi:PhzF family phenazine biosynthesis protein